MKRTFLASAFGGPGAAIPVHVGGGGWGGAAITATEQTDNRGGTVTRQVSGQPDDSRNRAADIEVLKLDAHSDYSPCCLTSLFCYRVMI